MQEISIDRAVRCIAIVLADNATGRFIATNLISNMFDLDRERAHNMFVHTKTHLVRHQKAGGMLRDFEDGNFKVD